MNKHSLLFVICILALAAGMAAAMHYQGGGYDLWLVPNSGSSVDLNPPGPTHLQDIKGYPYGLFYGDTLVTGLGILASGEAGPVIEPEPGPIVLDEGPVILNIERDSDTAGSALKITWRINTADYPLYPPDNPVDIYYLTGSGSGEYSTNIGYTQVVNASSTFLSSPGISGSVSPGIKTMVVNSQVATGFNELYFKGLIATSVPSALGDYGLAGAVAVGKVNIALDGTSSIQGKNLISVPFLGSPEATLAKALGDGSDAPWVDGDLVQFKFAPSPAYKTAEYKAGAWKDSANTANPPPFEIEPNKGYVFVVNAPKTFSAIGKVINVPVAHEIYAKGGEASGGKTNLGLIYPVLIGLTGTSLIADGAQEGDIIQYKTSAVGEAYISANVTGGIWVNDANSAAPIDPRIAALKVPNSYVYVRYGTAGFNWNRTAPTGP